jgi:hypothetical protein
MQRRLDCCLTLLSVTTLTDRPSRSRMVSCATARFERFDGGAMDGEVLRPSATTALRHARFLGGDEHRSRISF